MQVEEEEQLGVQGRREEFSMNCRFHNPSPQFSSFTFLSISQKKINKGERTQELMINLVKQKTLTIQIRKKYLTIRCLRGSCLMQCMQ